MVRRDVFRPILRGQQMQIEPSHFVPAARPVRRCLVLFRIALVGFLSESASACSSQSETDDETQTTDAGRTRDSDDEARDTSRDVADVPDAESPEDTRGDFSASETSDLGSDVSAQDSRPAETSDAGDAPDSIDATLTPETQAAIDAAVAASESTRSTYCGCYLNEAPYNGNETLCRAELDGISVSPSACDLGVASQFPADAASFYACRQRVSEDLGTCFAPCEARAAATLGCVVPAATAAVACGSGLNQDFVSAYEACNP